MEETTEHASRQPVAQETPRRVPLSMIGGFAVLGATVGLFTGMSESPVAATVLSALFSLIGAAGLFALLRRFDQTEVAVQRMRSIGIGIISFCMGAVALVFVGIELREGRLGATTSVPTPHAGEFDVTRLADDVSASDLAKLTLLELELSQLALTPQNRDAVLRALATPKPSTRPSWTHQRVDLLREQAEQASRSLNVMIEEMNDMGRAIRAMKDELASSATDRDHPTITKTSDALTDLEHKLTGAHDLLVETADALDEFATAITPANSADRLSEVLELVSAFRASVQNKQGVNVPDPPEQDISRMSQRRGIRR